MERRQRSGQRLWELWRENESPQQRLEEKNDSETNPPSHLMMDYSSYLPLLLTHQVRFALHSLSTQKTPDAHGPDALSPATNFSPHFRKLLTACICVSLLASHLPALGGTWVVIRDYSLGASGRTRNFDPP